ncbi:hypothetical protein GCM10010193_24550 [Kitasatospora atroaurantiaca]|uniref:LPXTG-motif cell wall-anchored protein n=1 Tax=Kitasatospora atroaurantiaca TaxID=285545 RepID=A0A561F0T0_9ACTN|nr:hypothetical protein [Kitasatospora atroaurantiaca]TWE21474.1 hypothetical protein FB465_6657 [Kitasatospora atroaurantiaca]
MSPSPRSTAPVRRGTMLACTLGASAAVLAIGLAPAAQAAPGDNGDVKVHDSRTAVDRQQDDPKVCKFYLDAFNFDAGQKVTYTVDQQPPTGTAQVLAGQLTLPEGTGHTPDLSLPDGHYKVTWTFEGEQGSAKHKVFKVECATTSPTPPGGPIGGVGTGGGGSVHGPDTAEIAAGSAVLAVAAGLGIRAVRRRSARNATS